MNRQPDIFITDYGPVSISPNEARRWKLAELIMDTRVRGPAAERMIAYADQFAAACERVARWKCQT